MSTVDWSALIGAFVGAGIPAWIVYVRMIRDRRAVDALILGPALRLLDHLNPDPATMHVGTWEVEVANWKALDQKVETAYDGLLAISTGHPRRDIRELARQAKVKLAIASKATSLAVFDQLRNKDNPDWMDHARNAYDEAARALQELIDATSTRRWAPPHLADEVRDPTSYLRRSELE